MTTSIQNIIGKNYIAGEWLGSEQTIENINPSDTSDVIGHYAQASEEELNQAITAASGAQRIWQDTGIEHKYNVLMNIGNEIINDSKNIGYLLSREEGKTLAEGVGEVYRAGQFFTYYAAECLRQNGENARSTRPNIDVDVYREPVGNVAVISPWNFPIAIAAWKIAPALCFGNSVIWKPSNITPASAVVLANIIAKQDIPHGLFNLVMGSGSEIGNKLAGHKNINAVTFTGSVDVGRLVAASAMKNLTKIQMEMGSKNALIVANDADIDIAVSCAVSGAFGGTGQKCSASSRIIVDVKIYDEFVSKFVTDTKKLKVGHALDENTQIGPVVSQSQLNMNLENVAKAKKEGGEVIVGGCKLDMKTQGFYMAPTIVDKTKNDWYINTEELFAPMTNLIKAEGYEQALATANDTRFGLTAGIVTNSLNKAIHFKKNIKTGCAMVNLPTSGTDYHVPFGGRGKSSYGPREQGQYAKEFYTSVKTSYTYVGEV